MGRDKARLRLHGHSMLSIVRAVANETGQGVRIIRRDLVPRCGPLGGILTGLRSSRAEAVLFLACDMPLITVALLRRMTRAGGKGSKGVFSSQSGRVGFPMLLPVKAADAVQTQINAGCLSVQQLATALRAQKLRVGTRTRLLFNVNTPRDVRIATELLALRRESASAITGVRL